MFLPKLDKTIMRRKIYRTSFHLCIDAKILNKILVNSV